MDFTYTEEQEMVRELAATFAKNYVAPLSEQMDIDNTMPHHIAEKMAELGFMGINVPEEYGGAGMDEVSKALVIMEIAKVDASVAELLAVHTLTNDIFLKRGTEEQKKKYLPMLTQGGVVGGMGITEPNAGSDASKSQTEARLEGDHYVINGSKIFITNGPEAGVFVIFAMTDKTKGNKGLSAFIIESSFPGFSIGKVEDKMGLHGVHTSEIVFTDMIVPKENLLGKEGQGFKICMQTLDVGRIGIAAQALGIAEGAMEQAVEYTKGRVQFGKPISKFQNTQFTFADMAMRCESARLLTYQAAAMKQSGVRCSKQAAMAKLSASETAMWVTTKALQMFGGYGYTNDYPMERMMRDAKITEIYEGTSEVQRIVISGNMGL